MFVRMRKKEVSSHVPWRQAFVVAAALLPMVGAAAQEPEQSLAMKLDTITVTPTLTTQKLRLAPASGSVISREEIKERNADDLLTALRGEPGVSFTRAGGIGRKAILMRGMEAKHTLLLMDGRRIPTSDDVFGHADYEYGWVPMSQVERIEVVRGPMSTLYGSDALGGVVNMITRQPTEEWSGGLLMRAATTANKQKAVGSGRAAVYVAGKISDRLALRLTGDTSGQGRTKNRYNKGVSELEGKLHNTGGATAYVTLTPQQTVQLQYDQGRDKRYFDTQDPADFGDTTELIDYENRFNVNRQSYGVTWDGNFANWVAQARAYKNNIKVRNSADSNRIRPTNPQEMTDEVVDGHASYQFARHWLTVGAEYRNEELRNFDLDNGKRSVEYKALFVQDEIDLTDTLLFTAGVRYNRHNHFSDEFTPRAYLVWEATPDLVVKGGYGRGYRMPSLKQSSASYHSRIVAGGSIFEFIGNEDIKPEKSDSYELGVDWQLNTLNLNATVYHNEVRNLIENKLVGFAPGPVPLFHFQFDNVDKARMTGLETGFAWQAHPDVLWGGSVNYLKTKDLNTREQLLYRPKVTATTYLDWRLVEGLTARINAEHTGRQKFEPNTGDSRTTSPRYTLWGASLAKRFNEHFTVRGGVENIGDTHLAKKSINFRVVEHGRTVFLSTELEF